MSSHFYLIRTSIKNRFKELRRKPGKLILYLLVIVAIVASLIISMIGANHSTGSYPVIYLLPILFGFLLIFYAVSIQKGLASGDSIFEMSDVNLLFVSPVNPRATLLYGLIRLLGTSFWAGFFLLFQSSSLANFGVGFGGVLILFGAFILNMAALTILSLLIYSTTNGRPARKRLVRILAVVVFIPMLSYFAVRFLSYGNALSALNDLMESPVLVTAPIIGWTSAGAISLIEGDLLSGLRWIGLLVLSCLGMLYYIIQSRSDYYEDVLVATETVFEKKRAVAEGNLQAAGATNAKVRVNKTGLSGTGVRVFVYKHLRETFRQNRFGFFSMYMTIVAVCIFFFSFFLRNKVDVVLVLQILMWIQVFMIGTGRGLMETYSHHIYMIPGSPFRKLIWSNMELMLRTAMESVLFLGIPGIIMKSNLVVVLSSMVVYVFFSLMLLSINYLSMRYTEANISQGILLVIYLIAVLLFLAPGLVAALIIGFSAGGLKGTLIGLFILSAWELAVSVSCFALSRNVLHNCDMPTIKR